MASKAAANKVPTWIGPLKKWAYNASGFNKYDPLVSGLVAMEKGLHHDDVLYENEDVTEALRRLPDSIRQERNFRLVRAMQLTIQHTYLPKEQWTKFEEDVRYLQPYLQEVICEREEREEWDKSH